MWKTVRYEAPAKLNLALAVGPASETAEGARGYHPICSWMVTVDLMDELEVTRLKGDRLSRYAILWHKEAKKRSEIDWSVAKDLAVRAHVALERRAGRVLPVQMKLEKRIPVGGGLGGGSSNAAAMLVAVNEVHELGMTRGELAEVGREIGSDVPFLVHGGSAVVSGLGERVEQREHVEGGLHAVVVFPKVMCPTGEVYRLFDEIGGKGALKAEAVEALASGDAETVRRSEGLFNDLAEAAVRSAPELGEVLREVGAAAGRRAHVSGSGSSVFVMCDDEQHSEAVARKVEQETGLAAVGVRSTGGARKM